MRDKLRELIRELDPDIQDLVATVISLEREHLDSKKPRVKVIIRNQVDKFAKESLKNSGEL